MEMTTFVRKPFAVQAIEVTEENIAEIAELVGELKETEAGVPFIKVHPRLVPNVFKVYPGFWMTKMGDNVRCYSAKIFRQQFIESTTEIDDWVTFLNSNGKKVADEPELLVEEPLEVDVS